LRIVVATFATIAAVLGYGWYRVRAASKPSAATSAYALQGYAVGWRQIHRDAGCPTTEDIEAESELPSDAKTAIRDAWGARFQIECIQDRIIVRSAGPDKKVGTDDDVWAR
jgi:hypothetical protein